MNFCIRPSKTFEFDILEKKLSKLTGEVGLDAAAETMKNRKMFKTENYYGLDINLEFLKRGLKKNESENTFGIWTDIAELDRLPSNSADVVVSTNTLNILSRENRLAALKHLCRLTAPQGYLILNFSTKDRSLLEEMEKNVKVHFEKIEIIYTGNFISQAYEKMFERNGWLGSHPIAGTRPFLLISWLISRLEYLTCHTIFGNSSALIVCTEKKTNESKNKFDTSQFKIIEKNLFDLFN